MRSQLAAALVWVAALAGGGFSGWRLGERPDSLTFLSVGQGDCAVFSCRGTTILVDVGPRTPTFDAGEKVVRPKLQAMGIEGVDLIFITHPDEDHVGGLGALHKAYPTAKVAASAYFHGFGPMDDRLKEAGIQEDEMIWLPEESLFKVGPFSVLVDCPRWTVGEPDNDGSLFIRLTNDKNSAVLTGDASSRAEAIEGPLANWHALVLKVGHHGSKSATSERWLETVQPRYAVISCGRDNRYGHPDKSVVDRLVGDHIEVLRTDRSGDIRFESTSDGFRLCTNR